MSAHGPLSGVRRLFLDTAPVIYFVERNPYLAGAVDPVFDRLDDGSLEGVTSPVTLAECLIVPCRAGRDDAAQDFVDLIVAGRGITFWPTDALVARRAAELRAKYNLALADAFQAATALVSGCDAILTNDGDLQRVTEIAVVMAGDLTP